LGYKASRNVGVENFQPLDQASLKKKTIKIISATPDYLVVNKPAGLLTHPTMANEPTTLAFFLLKKYPEIKNVGEDLLRPGIVHRLDKEASGLLVVARTQKMFEHLKEQFKTRTIEKEYLILVHGRVAKDEGEINFPITRSETSDRMAARPLSNDGGTISRSPLQPGEKEARTEFLVEQRFVNFTLLRVKIHTGRTHQIRVHFLAYNHPVVGDQLYIQKKRKRTWDENLGRLFLHCTKLVFKDLENKACTFESSLPTELSDFLKLLS
jgi:23S rRNA pseudouridine1911/1915/1917 synthase